MSLHYLDYLFLGAFSTKERRKVKSIYHIFTGKRTVSVMLQSLRYTLSSYFGVFPKLKWENLEKICVSLANEQLLIYSDEGYILTEKGARQCQAYFNHHTKLCAPQQIRFVRIVPEFKKKSLFLVQVLSELSYQNKKYFPLLEERAEQNWLKLFLKSSDCVREDLPKMYGKEWLVVLDEIIEEHRAIFLDQFEGYNYIRKTARQVAEIHNLDEAEVVIIWHQSWLQIIEYLESNPSNLFLLNKIFEELKQEGFLSSSSVHQTYLLLKNGESPNDLSNRRRLKQSTINDHITELAIIYSNFPFHSFLDIKKIQYIEENMQYYTSIDYKNIQKKFPGISFFESRLMQVMNEVKKEHDR